MAEESRASGGASESSSTPSEGQSQGHSHGAHRPGPRGPRPGGGPGGGGSREGGRKYFRRKKVCKFCVEKIESINYKDVRTLAQFVAESGKIVPRRLTGVCTPHQRRLSTAIKQARRPTPSELVFFRSRRLGRLPGRCTPLCGGQLFREPERMEHE